MTEKDAATVLEDAADLLLVHGRCKGALRNKDGAFCALGALNMAATGHHAGHLAVASAGLAAFVALTNATPSRNIPVWNNDPDTDDDEVRDTLLLVAKSLRNGETS